MPEISEGTEVVTPDGYVKEVTDESFVLNTTNLVKVDQPIRVRVSRQFYAESLVKLAREYGFDDESGNHWGVIYKLSPNKGKIDTCPDPFDDQTVLSYRDDLPKIEAWLQANGESEDECETCHGTTTGRIGPSHTQYDCPDCTDESEYYAQPRPEDEEWLENLKQSVCGGLSANDKERLGFYGMTIEDIVLTLAEHIDNLESELKDCWENQQEYKNDVAELHRQNGHLRERIEEAREEINLGIDETRKDEPHLDTIRGNFAKAGDILSPDSDEGDGGCG